MCYHKKVKAGGPVCKGNSKRSGLRHLFRVVMFRFVSSSSTPMFPSACCYLSTFKAEKL